ncbi:uncharacterized protein K452DRAFT_360068 [Aplosporella prunicola CBS 121167]|uniref:Uncharacterized protein n=1 Tax=Aplosporella prunicola CBS 121167 TaxID=1176127 RepID=A0A6A6B8Y4_9PEZI|nr:uncharacterized protein K452DRAFT_360068 [Aplosporella prunicola CBS 121167]KAF2139823.1 hypothetical protein K452DRAFT_360068 [Aplosporella prunicola CBS 121167]
MTSIFSLPNTAIQPQAPSTQQTSTHHPSIPSTPPRDFHTPTTTLTPPTHALLRSPRLSTLLPLTNPSNPPAPLPLPTLALTDAHLPGHAVRLHSATFSPGPTALCVGAAVFANFGASAGEGEVLLEYRGEGKTGVLVRGVWGVVDVRGDGDDDGGREAWRLCGVWDYGAVFGDGCGVIERLDEGVEEEAFDWAGFAEAEAEAEAAEEEDAEEVVVVAEETPHHTTTISTHLTTLLSQHATFVIFSPSPPPNPNPTSSTPTPTTHLPGTQHRVSHLSASTHSHARASLLATVVASATADAASEGGEGALARGLQGKETFSWGGGRCVRLFEEGKRDKGVWVCFLGLVEG